MGALYSLQVAVFATLFLESWRREEGRYAHEWGLYNQTKEQVRPEFDGTYDPILDTMVVNPEREHDDESQVIQLLTTCP